MMPTRRDPKDIPVVWEPPLRRWWQRSFWEWMSLTHILSMGVKLVGILVRRDWGEAPWCVTLFLLWIGMFTVTRHMDLKARRRRLDSDNRLNEINSRDASQIASFYPHRVEVKNGVSCVTLH